MSAIPLKSMGVGAVLVTALAFASTAAADGTPTPGGTVSPTAAPTGTPWPAPTGIELTSSVTVLNPDGSFMAPELRTMTNTITWDASGGFTGVYEVQRSRRMRHSSETKDFKQLNVLFPASASQGKLRQADTVGFIEALGYEFCYRVRAVINGETGPFSPEVCTIAPPSSGPVPAAETSVPGHPLQVLYGPQPPGSEQLGGSEDTSGLPSFDTLAGIRRVAPQALPATLQGYWLVDASGHAGNGLFSAQARFRGDGDRLLVIRSWTKTDAFVKVVPANSPVTEVRQAYLEGLAALTLMPTPAVVGGIGPREIWMTDGATIWYLDFGVGYSDNAEALALAAEVARAVQSPGAPATGTAYGAGTDGWVPLWAILIGAGGALAGAAAATLVRRGGRTP